MKKKIFTALLLPIFCLMSCTSKLNPVGKYSFRLGKESETHVGVSMELTDVDHIIERVDPDTGETVKEVAGKEFTASLDSGDMIKINLEDLGVPYIGIDISQLNKMVNEYINETLKNLKGYYVVSDIEQQLGYRLKLGSSIELPEDLSPTGEPIDIPPELIERVLAAFINEKQITLQIPVSTEDFLHQLCWYGVYINFDDPTGNIVYVLDPEKLPGESHEDLRIGSHPVIKYESDGVTIKENQIDIMNKMFAAEFSNTPVYARKADPSEPDKCIGKLVEYSREEIGSDGEIVTIYDHYFYTLSGEEQWLPSSDRFEAMIKCKRPLYNTFDLETDINIDLDKEELERVGFAQILGPHRGDGEERLDRYEFMQKSFVFRDYNDIKIGLTKE